MRPDSHKIRRILRSDLFNICEELRETIDDRKEWHTNGHQPDCKDDPCQIDPLYHRIVRLNWALAVKRQACLEAGIPQEEIEGIKKFWKLI